MKISKRYEFDGGRLFVGANSASGFVSFYDTILNDEKIEKIYIIKGGPGTGKSRFMGDAAKRAEELSYSVERYYCSSDPDSLDAVVIGGKYALLDGTAPHTVEASCAGAREEIINLGAFWDSDRLAESLDKIKELSKKKSKCYKRAYRYLEAAENVREINNRLILPTFLENKAKGAVDRIFGEIKKGGSHSLSVGMICSVSMKGRVRFDTYEHFADKVYLVDDFYGVGALYLRLIIMKAIETDTPVRVSYDPLDTISPNAVFFPNDKKAFLLGREGDILPRDAVINMRRFVDNTALSLVRSEYRFNEKLYEALLSSAEEKLREAGKHHFELEKIYEECMDFGSKEVFCNNFLNNLFNN
ncbi:MAG: hypothetical protein IKB02_07475 [Clostridia bacterium]|nr:hypothetical protein [Clostridia bacterium]